MFAYELKNVTAGSAGEALVNPDGGIDAHGRGTVVMKRTAPHIAAVAGTFQRQKVLDDLRNICVALQLSNNVIGIKRHRSNLVKAESRDWQARLPGMTEAP